MEEKNKHKQNKDKCPLCEVSEETIKKLKEAGREKTEQKPKLFRKGLIILGLIGVAVFSVYIFISGFSSLTPQNNESSVIADFKNSNEKETPQINALAPDFVSEDIFGNRVALSDFRDKKPVLLIFWATWCGSCAKELPELKIFAQKHQDKIQVLTVDSGESKQTIKDYIQEKDINFLMLLDENRKIWNQYLIRGTPSHFLINKEGKIITMRPGFASLADLETMLSMIPKE